MDQVILLAERILAERIFFGAAALHFSSLVAAPQRSDRNDHGAAPRLKGGGGILLAQQISAMDPA